MASFDIKSLFPNIPLMETIDICVNQCKENLPINLTISQFKSLLETAVKELVFVFNINNKLYQQIDGVAMGSPLEQTLANAFLCFLKKKRLASCPLESLSCIGVM